MASLRYHRKSRRGGNCSRDSSHSNTSCAPLELLHERHAHTKFSPRSKPNLLREIRQCAADRVQGNRSHASRVGNEQRAVHDCCTGCGGCQQAVLLIKREEKLLRADIEGEKSVPAGCIKQGIAGEPHLPDVFIRKHRGSDSVVHANQPLIPEADPHRSERIHYQKATRGFIDIRQPGEGVDLNGRTGGVDARSKQEVARADHGIPTRCRSDCVVAPILDGPFVD